ncbi:AgaS family sugar isomerase [Enterobacter cloacae]|uniref:AgaS family sugar isomerase n=1 Tax=Enterobacter cloacae TaxID=550 RepID=A0A377LTU5_ENTCL|nr:AgaS family sugar isomerase [Enterobacter cloacae]
MPQITPTATTGTWTEEEIRQQPASWIRSLHNIDNLRSSIDSFLTPLLRKHDLRIVLTGAGTSAFIGDIHCAMACGPHREKHLRRSDNRSGHKPDGLLQPCTSAAADLFLPFR